ncbi:hypothetical protein C1H76_2784 [Elsinoe australis]|uniref:Spherulin-4 n=1 Tax=Elsinoe australis TaxID=40998 RepID=A0A4U7BAY4_9PEZI|nr:hypothetical protein C1H76_2784 [Elsinoe australis]
MKSAGGAHMKQPRRKWFWPVIFAATIIVLVVVIVPCAVILTRRNKSNGLASSILFPLYVFPHNSSTWDPLYTAASANPQLNFTVVVNPGNGPGNESIPDTGYRTAIEKLHTYANIQIVGYVHTSWTSRNISLVLDDIATYSGWTANDPDLVISGIFFDETPTVYSSAASEYLESINAAVKSSSGIRSPKTVIHNPGAVPDAGLNSDTTDITIAFESSLDDYQTKQSALASLPLPRSRYSSLVHSAASSYDMKDLVDRMSRHSAYLFVTDLSTDYYQAFGSDWSDFVNAVPT